MGKPCVKSKTRLGQRGNTKRTRPTIMLGEVKGLPPTPWSVVDLSLILSRPEKLEQGQCVITDMLRKPQQ